MASEHLPFFLAHAREWWAVADTLRAIGVRPADPALSVWREAAWCHLLFAAGKHAAALERLRAVDRDVIGVPPEYAPVPSDQAAALAEAAERLARMKAAVIARYSAAFAQPVAA